MALDIGLALLIVIALGFDFTNGFHDAANAIATSVSTRALTPRVALGMAAVLNLAGALLATGVAATIGKGIIEIPVDPGGAIVLATAALVGAITWNLITWYFGLPSSSSHALIGGLVGAAIAASSTVKWTGVIDKVIIPMVLSPIVGIVVGYLFHLALLWIVHRGSPSKLNRGFRHVQTLSAAAMSFSHGTQDAQKTMGVITFALVATGHVSREHFHVPWWVIGLAAGAISLGTYSGGWRIMRTLGRRIIQLDPSRGFAAETTAASVLLSAAHFGVPLSTTHVITSSILGVGATKRFSAVRWGVAGNIVIAWVLTLPAAGTVAAAVFFLLHWGVYGHPLP
ncbi:MAG TPA: inorganic phosphate transporter [Mycobacteriales bacterium]|jgi:PiT family inorganic phosphate transporter|nr:inorganic phosphate transporter [Mycobacteriales bacterium]